MPASFTWQDGASGGTALTAANFNRAALVADIGIAGTPTGDAGRAVFGTRTQALLARLDAKQAVPAVLTSPPTVTYDASATLWNQQLVSAASPAVTLLGTAVQYDPPSGKVFTPDGAVGLDFYATTDKVEITWTSQQSNAEKVWLWIDGQPTTAAPVLPLATTGGTEYCVHITFAAVGKHRVTFYAGNINSFHYVGTTTTGIVQPAPRRPRIAFVGDSFFDYSGAIANPIDSAPFPCAILLGAECIQAGVGGTGYGTQNPFGTAARVNAVAAAKPDLIVINGSVNDATSGLQAAATSTYQAYASACPGVPVIVFGPQPTDAPSTIGATRQQQIAAVKAAATTAPNVIAFHDRVGTAAGIPPAWSSGATYNEGDLVTSLGAVWRWTNGGTAGNESSPRLSLRWSLVTWDYIGTGRVGSPAGDGNRDTFLFSDGVHPTAVAAQADAARMAGVIAADLAAH